MANSDNKKTHAYKDVFLSRNSWFIVRQVYKKYQDLWRHVHPTRSPFLSELISTVCITSVIVIISLAIRVFHFSQISLKICWYRKNEAESSPKRKHANLQTLRTLSSSSSTNNKSIVRTDMALLFLCVNTYCLPVRISTWIHKSTNISSTTYFFSWPFFCATVAKKENKVEIFRFLWLWLNPSFFSSYSTNVWETPLNKFKQNTKTPRMYIIPPEYEKKE